MGSQNEGANLAPAYRRGPVERFGLTQAREDTMRFHPYLRLDIAGTLDIKPVAMELNNRSVWVASTVTISLSLPPFEIEVKLFQDSNLITLSPEPFSTRVRQSTILAAYEKLADWFGIRGFKVRFANPEFFGCGLGASGAALTGVAYLINKTGRGITIETGQLPCIASAVENEANLGLTGLQDQCAALASGVNLWNWWYEPLKTYTRHRVPIDLVELEKRLVLAITRTKHNSTELNRLQLKRFSMEDFKTINLLAYQFFMACENGDFSRMMELIDKEHSLRKERVPERMTEQLKKLESIAQKVGCAFAVAGAGGGGACWALAETEAQAVRLYEEWANEPLELLMFPNVAKIDWFRESTGQSEKKKRSPKQPGQPAKELPLEGKDVPSLTEQKATAE